MTRVLSVLLALLVTLAATPAHAVPAKSVTVADLDGDQTHNDLWKKYPKLRPATDLREATWSVAKGKLTLTWTFEAAPNNKRAYQNVGMSAGIGSKQLTVGAWRLGDESYTSVSTGLGSESKFYCQDKVTIKNLAKQRKVVVTLPVKCLPKGKVLKYPYPAVGVSVVKKNGILEGYVGSDSSVGAADLTIRD